MLRMLSNKVGLMGLGLILLLLVWEFVSQINTHLKFVLPAPSQIAITLWQHKERFFVNAIETFKEMCGGFLLAFIVSFPLAWLMASYDSLKVTLQPFFVTVQCIPMFALAPIMVLWFGWSYTAIVVPTALMIFFPLTMNIYKGLCSTPSSLLEFFYLHQATRWQIFLKLQLPWALPHIFAGFRISVAMAGIGAVAGEWAGAQRGLGILMLESRRAADMEMMFGALVCITAMSLMCYGLVTYLEWRIEQRQHRGRSVSGTIFSLLLMGILGVGCQQSTSSEKEVTLLLDWLPNPDHVPLYAGIEKGFFAEAGINLKILKVADPSDSIPYLTSGQVNLSLTYMPHAVLSMSKGAPVLPIAVLMNVPLNALIFREGEGIKTPKDLNGKILGYAIDGFNLKLIEKILHNQKIVPKEMVNVSFDLVGTLATKQVDVIYGAYWNIEPESLRSHGIETSFFPLSDFGVPTYYELIFLALKGTPEATPRFIETFQKALQKSIDFSRQYPKIAFEEYLKANPDKSQKTQKWEWQAWLKTIPVLTHSQKIDPLVWNYFVNWLIVEQIMNEKQRSDLLLNLEG